MTSIAVALNAARAKLPASEARLLLGHVLDKTAAWLIAHDDETLDEDSLLRFASLVARRVGGEPVAYLTGAREFYGRAFAVSGAVLIPRPETELLVDVVLEKIPRVRGSDGDHGLPEEEVVTLLDLGTGSGCIAITLAIELPWAKITGVDASTSSLAVAQENAVRHGVSLRLLHSDWFSELSGERFDLIVANPPYIAAADPHLSVGDLRHEPSAALASGADGLDALRHIVANAPAHLATDGQLWLEHGYDQAESVRELLAAAGLKLIDQYRDLAGIVRVSGGQLG